MIVDIGFVKEIKMRLIIQSDKIDYGRFTREIAGIPIEDLNFDSIVEIMLAINQIRTQVNEIKLLEKYHDAFLKTKDKSEGEKRDGEEDDKED